MYESRAHPAREVPTARHPPTEGVCGLRSMRPFRSHLHKLREVRRGAQVTARDRDPATEQTSQTVSVTSLIVQTIEHKDNGFKYIVIHAFDRNRYAFRRERGWRRQPAGTSHRLSTPWALKAERPPGRVGAPRRRPDALCGAPLRRGSLSLATRQTMVNAEVGKGLEMWHGEAGSSERAPPGLARVGRGSGPRHPGAGGHRWGASGPGRRSGPLAARPATPPVGQSVNEAGAFTPPVCLVLSRRSYSGRNSQRNTNHHIPPGVVSLVPANYPEGQRKVFYREKPRTRLPGGPDPWEAHSRQAPGRTPGPCPWCHPSRPPAFWKRHRDPRFWLRTPHQACLWELCLHTLPRPDRGLPRAVRLGSAPQTQAGLWTGLRCQEALCPPSAPGLDARPRARTRPWPSIRHSTEGDGQGPFPQTHRHGTPTKGCLPEEDHVLGTKVYT